MKHILKFELDYDRFTKDEIREYKINAVINSDFNFSFDIEPSSPIPKEDQ